MGIDPSGGVTGCGAPRVFLVLHGWDNFRPQDHWQRWLTEQLLTRGDPVVYPQLPDAAHPALDVWIEFLDATLRRLEGAQVTLICHSLACALWFRYCERNGAADMVDRVLIVSPPSPELLAAGAVGEFVDGSRRIQADGRSVRVVTSDNDPYCPEGAALAYDIDASVPVTVVPRAGHITGDTGFGSWPELIELIDAAETPDPRHADARGAAVQ